jgi:predicted nucleic acid-binding protein
MKPLRIYIDTSVFGGCLDEEFEGASKKVFEAIGAGHLILLLSETVVAELEPAPPAVKALLKSIASTRIENVAINDAVIQLRDAYIRHNVIGERWIDDATHVAAATVARADAIISWNFKHIVRLDRINAYNEVNAAKGYGHLTILSPHEVSYDD